MHSINAFNQMNAQKHQVFMSCKKNYETFRNKVIFFTLRNYVCAQDTILDAKSPISGLFPPRFRLWTRKIMLKQSGMHNLSKNQPKKFARSISGSQNSTMKNRVVHKTPFWMLNHQFLVFSRPDFGCGPEKLCSSKVACTTCRKTSQKKLQGRFLARKIVP